MNKSLSRVFRKSLHNNNMGFPLKGVFSLFVNGKEIKNKDELPKNLKRCKGVEVVQNGVIEVKKQSTPTKKKEEVPNTERSLYKKVVREADPEKPNSKRRTDYRLVKNPKSGETYYAKIDGKWVEVPSTFAYEEAA